MKMPQALIFDVDGTLAETERFGHRVAFNDAFHEAGLNWYWDTELYGELLRIAGGKERIEHFIHHFQPDIPSRFASQSVACWCKTLHEAKNRQYRSLLREGRIRLRPGVSRLLREATQQGWQLGIATTSSLENVLALLDSTLGPEGVKMFDFLSTQDGNLAQKPAPDLYHKALDGLAVDATEAIAIEDSAIGVEAAVAAGIPVVACYNAYSQDQDFRLAVAEIDGFGTTEQPAQTRRGKPPSEGMITVQALTVWWRIAKSR